MMEADKVYLVKRPVTLADGRKVKYWSLRWADTDGKLRQESVGRVGRITRAVAEGLKAQKLIDLAGGRVLRNRPRKMTLDRFTQEHGEAVKSKLSGSTLTEYEMAARHAMEALGRDVLIERIGPAQIGRIETHLFETKKHSAATVSKTLRSLRAMFSRAVKWHLIPKNPFSGWEIPQAGARDARIFTRAEIDTMVAAAPSVWWEAFIRLAADSGLRKLELLHLRWSDVDLDAGTVSVASRRAGAFEAAGREYPIIAWTVKAKTSTRMVPVPETTVAVLQKRQMASGGSAYIFFDLRRLEQLERHLAADGALPANFDVRPSLIRDFHVIQGRARELLAKRRRAELRDVKWPVGCVHDLRRSWCTHLAGAVPMHVLKEYAGHADIATTAKHYLKTSDDDAARVRKALGAA